MSGLAGAVRRQVKPFAQVDRLHHAPLGLTDPTAALGYKHFAPPGLRCAVVPPASRPMFHSEQRGSGSSSLATRFVDLLVPPWVPGVYKVGVVYGT